MTWYIHTIFLLLFAVCQESYTLYSNQVILDNKQYTIILFIITLFFFGLIVLSVWFFYTKLEIMKIYDHMLLNCYLCTSLYWSRRSDTLLYMWVNTPFYFLYWYNQLNSHFYKNKYKIHNLVIYRCN